MNDRFKFRAWNTVGKQIVDHDNLIMTCDGFSAVDEEGTEFPMGNIMQSTGFRDKNEKLIFAGDIVKFHFHDEEDSYGGTAIIVDSLNNGVGIMYDWLGYSCVRADDVFAVDEGGIIEEYWDDKELWSIEVLGNIYENPELIHHFTH